MNKRENDEFQTFAANFPPVCPEMDSYVTDVIFEKSRYLFVKSQMRIQYGHCTHCKKTYRTEGLRQNNKTTCTHCHSSLIVKMAGVSRKYLVDKGHVIFYEKSVTNPNAIVARGFYVVRDYTNDYAKVETKYTPTSMYLFDMEGSMKYVRSYDYSSGKRAWKKAARITNDYESGLSRCPKDWIENAVKGTPFQYSTWEQYFAYGDGTEFFDLFTKHPCIEYLTKLNMRYFVTAKLHGSSTYSSINWDATTLHDVLKLTKQRAKQFINWVREADYPAALTLRLFQRACKENSKLTLDDLNNIAENYSHSWGNFKNLISHISIQRGDSYLRKQQEIERQNKRPYDVSSIFTTYKDYINDCKLLGFDLSQELIRFPSNLHNAHQNTISQVKVVVTAEPSFKINKRVASLEKFIFEKEGLLIRPALSTRELIEEGKALSHCVGTYAEKYVEGKCDILVIRRVSEPNTPYFTVEMKNKQIIQCRGLKNCGMTDKVRKFMDQFKSEKLTKKKKVSTKQEVAV